MNREGEGGIRGMGGGAGGLTSEEVRPRGGYEHSCVHPHCNGIWKGREKVWTLVLKIHK